MGIIHFERQERHLELEIIVTRANIHFSVLSFVEQLSFVSDIVHGYYLI